VTKIDPQDVKYTGFVATVRVLQRARHSRALDDRQYKFTFEHVPTGKRVTVDTGVIHWSRKETQRQIEALRVGKAVELLEKTK
jgi:hypothetical protein